MSDEPFDFPRYFARVQSTPDWQQFQLGMAQFAEVQPTMSVLDVGCGPGRLVRQLQELGVHAVGADSDWWMAVKARSIHPDLPINLATVENLPYATNQFDAVLAANLLFLLSNPLRALQEMVRVLRPGGKVAVWNPSERMSRKLAFQFTQQHPEIDEFARKHIVNWAGIAEAHRRWNGVELQHMFEEAGLNQFATELVLGGLARYARGEKSEE